MSDKRDERRERSMLNDREWQKSSKSGAAGHCVEVALNSGAGDGGKIFVRNSNNPFAGITSFTQPEWTAFIEGVKGGEFDLP